MAYPSHSIRSDGIKRSISIDESAGDVVDLSGRQPLLEYYPPLAFVSGSIGLLAELVKDNLLVLGDRPANFIVKHFAMNVRVRFEISNSGTTGTLGIRELTRRRSPLHDGLKVSDKLYHRSASI